MRWIFALVSLMGFGAFSFAFFPLIGYAFDYTWLCRMGKEGPPMALNTALALGTVGLAVTIGFLTTDHWLRWIIYRFLNGSNRSTPCAG